MCVCVCGLLSEHFGSYCGNICDISKYEPYLPQELKSYPILVKPEVYTPGKCSQYSMCISLSVRDSIRWYSELSEYIFDML